jgi:hypothetical protein
MFADDPKMQVTQERDGKIRMVAAFIPAITSLNALKVVRLNRSISILLIVSNLFTHSRLDQAA